MWISQGKYTIPGNLKFVQQILTLYPIVVDDLFVQSKKDLIVEKGIAFENLPRFIVSPYRSSIT